jgi:hypothetical protein
MSNEFTLQQWINTKSDVYNLDVEFEHQIKPLLEDVRNRCKKIGLPFIAVFGVQQTEEKAMTISTTHLEPTSRICHSLLNTYMTIDNTGVKMISGLAAISSAASDKAEKGNL